MIWGIIFAGLIAASGRVVDYYVREEKIHWQYWIIPFSFLAFGFISSAVFGSLYESLFNWPYSFSTDPFKTGRFVLNTSTGVLIALVGAVTYHYIKEMYILKDKEIEIDNQTKITIEES